MKDIPSPLCIIPLPLCNCNPNGPRYFLGDMIELLPDDELEYDALVEEIEEHI